MKIEELDFSVRTYHVLKRAGIDTVEELRQKTDDDLFMLRNAGAKTVAEIRAKVGHRFKTNEEHIRTMSRKDLARFLCALMNSDDCDERCPAREYCYPGHNGMEEYLSSPAEEE